MSIIIKCNMIEEKLTRYTVITLDRIDALTIIYNNLKAKGYDVEQINDKVIHIRNLRNLDQFDKLNHLEFPQWYTPTEMTERDLSILNECISKL